MQVAQSYLGQFARVHIYDPIADFYGLDNPHQAHQAQFDEVARTMILHPCRGCPHLRIGYVPIRTPEDVPPSEPKSRISYGNALVTQTMTPEEKRYTTLPRPFCTIAAETRRDPSTGQVVLMTQRETWQRCPLYGISDMASLVRDLHDRIDDLERRIDNDDEE